MITAITMNAKWIHDNDTLAPEDICWESLTQKIPRNNRVIHLSSPLTYSWCVSLLPYPGVPSHLGHDLKPWKPAERLQLTSITLDKKLVK